CPMAFSPDGKTLATRSKEETVTLWDAIRYEPRIILKGHAEWLGFTPDGDRLVTYEGNGVMRLWETSSGQLLATGKESGGWALAISLDGKYLAASTGDKHGGSVEVCDLNKLFHITE